MAEELQPGAAGGAKPDPREKLLWLQSSPHIARPENTQKIMCNVLVALTPAAVFGIAIFGIGALLNIAVALSSAILGEALFRRITRQPPRTRDLSACVTGLLLALVIPPGTPLWMTALGAVFAVVVAKEFFGGLGANVFNPALAGRAFMLMSFPAALTTWITPARQGSLFRPDGGTGATPLAVVKPGEGADALSQASPMAGLAESLGLQTPFEAYKELFLGFRGGCIGETSILLILAGAVFLLVKKTIDWRAPVAMLASAALFGALLGADPVFTLLSGGLVFGAFFMATDYTTAPVTEGGKLLFGAGAGLLVVLIRQFGDYPEGVMFAILIMNILTPFLNKVQHKKYGAVTPAKKAAQGGPK